MNPSTAKTLRRSGELGPVPTPDRLFEPGRLIPLRGRRDSVRAVSVVDESDYGVVSNHRWHLCTMGYAQRVGPDGRTQMLHRAIVGLEPGDPLEVDHVNGDKLDNRRSNLRVCTHAENSQNQPTGRSSRYSPHRGVTWHKSNHRWIAQCKLNYKNHWLGSFKTEAEAAAAVQAFRAEHMPFSEEAA